MPLGVHQVGVRQCCFHRSAQTEEFKLVAGHSRVRRPGIAILGKAVVQEHGFVRVARFVQHDNYDAVVATDIELLKNPVVVAAVGTAAMAADAAGAAYRAAERVPVFGPLMRRGVAGLTERGDRWVAQSADQFKALVATVAVQLVDLILDELDLNALVRERVDIDALAADLDIEAVINRVDLIALADRVIEGVDLPAIIRESTNSMTAEVMTDVRTQGERADDVVAAIVDRILGRDRENR